MRIRYLVLAVLLAIPLYSEQASLRRISSLIRQLGVEQFSKREAAQAELADMDPALVKGPIQEALKHDNAEIRFRARQLLLIIEYQIPTPLIQRLLPLIERLEQTEPEQAMIQTSILRGMARLYGRETVPVLLHAMPNVSDETQAEISALLSEHSGEWQTELIAALNTIPAEALKRLGGFPGHLYIQLEQYQECEAFLTRAMPYIDLDAIRILFENLTNVNHRNYSKTGLPPLARMVYGRFLDEMAQPEKEASEIIAIAHSLIEMVAPFAPDLVLELQYIIAENGDFSTALSLAIHLYNQKDYMGAAEMTGYMKPEDKEDIYLRDYLAILTAGYDETDELNAVKKLREQHNDNEVIHFRSGWILSELGRNTYEEAEYRIVTSIPPDDSPEEVEAYLRLADNAYTRMDYAAAGQDFKKVIEIADHQKFGGQGVERARKHELYCRVYVLLDENKAEEALALIESIKDTSGYEHERSPFSDLEYEIILGQALAANGREKDKEERSTAVYTHYFRIKDNYPNGAAEAFWCNNIAWYLAQVKSQTARAISFSRRSLEIEPDTSMYLDTLAECFYAHGEPDQALVYIEQAIEHHRNKLMLTYYQLQKTKFEEALEEEVGG